MNVDHLPQHNPMLAAPQEGGVGNIEAYLD
jgi:hypothetical protein